MTVIRAQKDALGLIMDNGMDKTKNLETRITHIMKVEKFMKIYRVDFWDLFEKILDTPLSCPSIRVEG